VPSSGDYCVKEHSQARTQEGAYISKVNAAVPEVVIMVFNRLEYLL